MALPIILVNSSTGSDTTASGAGPSTAISGSTARTSNTGSPIRIGLFGATDDLSGVATDGSHVIYMAISTAGQRNFCGISAVKNTRETGSDGAITSGTAIVTLGSTTGISVSDVFMIAGAGVAGADLYSTINAVGPGNQVTLADNASTTVGPSANWECPKQVSFTSSQTAQTGATDTAWAIGGKRATIAGTNGKKLADNNSSSGDAMPGWIIEMESGYTETIAAEYAFRRAGDTTDGPITLRGASGAATKPILTFSNNGGGITARASTVHFRDFTLKNSNGTKTASYGITAATGFNYYACGITINDSSNKFYRGIYSGQSGPTWVVDCEVGYCADAGIYIDGSQIQIRNCYLHDNTGHGLQITGSSPATDPQVIGCLFVYNGGRGMSYTGGGGGINGMHVIRDCTFAHNTSDGLFLDNGARTVNGLDITNCIFANNGGYGLNLNSGTFTNALALAYGVIVRGSCFYGNTSGKYNPLTYTYSYDEVTTDPQFTNAAGRDFSVGTNMKAKGHPLGGALPVGGTAGTTYTYLDPGAAQRQESGGGGGFVIGG